MFQSFEVTSRPEQGPPRLAALRKELEAEALDGFLVPRADAHQGEYVAPRDDRLKWLTGFTGSAGFCAALRDVAGVFIDGRYRTQVKAQVADVYTPVAWPEVSLAEWLRAQLPQGGVIGFDPWLHAAGQIVQLEDALDGSGITLRRTDNLVDRIWEDQPAPPMNPAKVHPIDYAGEAHGDKIARLAEGLRDKGRGAAVITLPDSLCWLLNIRGSDIARNPVVHGFAVLHSAGHVDAFVAPSKLEGLEAHLGAHVTLHAPEAFLDALGDLAGPVLVEKATVPVAVWDALGDRIVWGDDPCALPKACKNAAEIEGSVAAHLRDGAALVEVLAWLDAQPAGSVTETQVVTQLETARRRDPALQEISFETIAGTGPNGAIMHYRVTEDTDSLLQDGHLLVLDSGGQYLDGTTDITRTVWIGPGEPTAEMVERNTRVLKGHIQLDMQKFPDRTSGGALDALARMHLWNGGVDYGHGTGHGGGSFLSVHEGPQRISKPGGAFPGTETPLREGMILSNEPGYYKPGEYGIRIENLVLVVPAGIESEGDYLGFETLTFVPLDRRLVDKDLLSPAEIGWWNDYHAKVRDIVAPQLDGADLEWLEAECAPL